MRGRPSIVFAVAVDFLTIIEHEEPLAQLVARVRCLCTPARQMLKASSICISLKAASASLQHVVGWSCPNLRIHLLQRLEQLGARERHRASLRRQDVRVRPAALIRGGNADGGVVLLERAEGRGTIEVETRL